MPYIEDVAPEDATGELKEAYGRYSGKTGSRIANILRIHGLNPPSFDTHIGLYRTLMFGKSPLRRAQRELIGVVVSTANHCRY